jgi:hypothetical protein
MKGRRANPSGRDTACLGQTAHEENRSHLPRAGCDFGYVHGSVWKPFAIQQPRPHTQAGIVALMLPDRVLPRVAAQYGVERRLQRGTESNGH